MRYAAFIRAVNLGKNRRVTGAQLKALFEEAVHDDQGQLLTGSFAAYPLPSAVEVPAMEGELLETPSPFTPLGVKGLGESGAIAVPAAIANAVADALAPLGVRHLDPLQAGAAVAGAGPVALRSGQRWRASSASVPTVFQFLVLAATLSFRSRKALFSLVLP